MSQTRIDTALDSFHGRVENVPQPRLLIATTASFGVGQTLNEAIGLGLLEPDFRLHTMLQVYGRHCRQGNKNPKTWCWLFLAMNNDVEDKITSVNKMRARIQETTEGKVARDSEVITIEDDEA